MCWATMDAMAPQPCKLTAKQGAEDWCIKAELGDFFPAVPSNKNVTKLRQWGVRYKCAIVAVGGVSHLN